MLWAAGAGIAELIGFAAFYRALAIGAMGVVAPISATAALCRSPSAWPPATRRPVVQAGGMRWRWPAPRWPRE